MWSFTMPKLLYPVVLPFCGFYESWLEHYATDFLEQEDIESGQPDYDDQDFGIYYRKVGINYGERVLWELSKACQKVIKGKNWSLTFAKDYCTQSDKLVFEVDFAGLINMHQAVDKEKLLNAFVYHGTARSGYMPLIKPEIPRNPMTEWSAAERGVVMEVLIEQYLAEEFDLQDATDALMGVVEDMSCNGTMTNLYYEALTESRKLKMDQALMCSTPHCTKPAVFQISNQSEVWKMCHACYLDMRSKLPDADFQVFKPLEPVGFKKLTWREGTSRAYGQEGQNTYTLRHEGKRVALFLGGGYSLEDEALIEAVNKLYGLSIKNTGADISKQMAQHGVEVEYHKKAKSIYVTYPSVTAGVKVFR